MTTSYSKNIRISDLFVYSIYIGQSSHLTFLQTKSRKNKNKLKTKYPKNHENFKNNKPRVQIYWFLQRVYSNASQYSGAITAQGF